MSMNGKDFLLGAVTGAVLGAVTALLFAPKTGRELRSDIVEQYHQVSQKGQELAGKAKQVAEHLVQDIKSWKSSKKEVAAAAEYAGSEYYEGDQ
jgi:Gas vesicle protein